MSYQSLSHHHPIILFPSYSICLISRHLCRNCIFLVATLAPLFPSVSSPSSAAFHSTQSTIFRFAQAPLGALLFRSRTFSCITAQSVLFVSSSPISVSSITSFPIHHIRSLQKPSLFHYCSLFFISLSNPRVIPSRGYRKLSNRKQPNPKGINRKPH